MMQLGRRRDLRLLTEFFFEGRTVSAYVEAIVEIVAYLPAFRTPRGDTAGNVVMQRNEACVGCPSAGIDRGVLVTGKEPQDAAMTRREKSEPPYKKNSPRGSDHTFLAVSVRHKIFESVAKNRRPCDRV